MAIYRCNACNGTYSDTMRDGGVYMHACPPLPPDEEGVYQERPDKRDETLLPQTSSRLVGIRSEGAGVTPLSHPRITEPAWITKLKAQLAEEEEKQ